MTIAIMQPYIFPYIGYFQLVHASDVFVFYDDVNFINRGWINRNRILLNGAEHMLTVPCKDASQNKLIMDIAVTDDAKAIPKLINTVKMAYAKAPYFANVFPLIEHTLSLAAQLPVTHTQPSAAFPSLDIQLAHAAAPLSIADMAIHSVITICNYLGIKREFRLSSQSYDNRELKKADRLIDICLRENIVHYVNAAGGKAIYDKEYYGAKGVKLDFMNAKLVEYSQFNNTFVPWLSIIDILMFNSKEDIINKILPSYYLD